MEVRRRPPRNQELEAAIVADPDSPDAYLVYGDWLLEQGEPLGELVSVQAAIAKKIANPAAPSDSKSRHLAHREKTLLAENARGWLGYFAKYQHTWRFGFLDTLILTEPGREDFLELLDLVAARFLRGLDVEVPGHRVFENAELISAIGEIGLPPILQRLAFVTANPRSVDLGSLRALWPRLARLKELRVDAGKIELGVIDLPAIETVTLATNATTQTIRALTTARWPNLRRLSLAFTSYQYEQAVDIETLELALAALAQVSTLTHLGLSGSWSGDELLDTFLAPAPPQLRTQLQRLTSLSLSRNAFSDEAAQTILKNQARFDHLESLDLSENYFTKPTCEALVNAFGKKKLNVANQGTANVDYGGGEDEEQETYDESDE